MRKLQFSIIFLCILLLPALTGSSQDFMLKSGTLPSRSTDDSRFTVNATVMDNDTWCRVEWPDPISNPWELAYDDGEVDDLFVYSVPGCQSANRFSPNGYPLLVTGGRLNVWDGSFPGPFIGVTFRVLVYDDDGENEMPGTVLDSTEVTVNNYGWVEFEGLTAEITEGDFYLSIKQLTEPPEAVPVGVDMDNPTYFISYAYLPDTGWVSSPLQDFMIRAMITYYDEPAREIDSFEVARFSGFEMYESPLTGDTTVLDTIVLSEYDDYEWDALTEGLYAYGVKTHFTNGQWSDYDVSNNVIHLFYLYPPSCFYQENDVVLIACPPLDNNGIIPENVIGLNLYLDMEFTGFISFLPEPPPFPVEIPIDFQPGIYNYTLTAVYDLSPYGYPGETGESAYLSTQVNISYGFPLPFLEDWNLGTFETNNWLTIGDNWSITGQEGQPAPSARFTWDPIQSDYSIALESYPLLAESLTEGNIYLDFDLKLDNVNPTGTEEMSVEVWNWEIQAWTTVSTYSNEDGSFDWMSEHLNITDQALGKVFKIRFLAAGENSSNILGWFVDNISVYRECIEPQNLTIDVAWPIWGFNLNWDYPYGPTNLWLEWDDGVNSGNSIGTGGECEFDVAARWTSEELAEYINYEIKKIDFFPLEESANYSVRIWTGLNAENLVLDQPVNAPMIGHWNEIWLDTALRIDVTQDLWIGYHVITQTGYPAGVDNGPAIDGYGNMMNFGGWQTLLEINPELNYNWNIKAYIEELGYGIATKFAIYRYDGDDYFFRDYAYENHYVDDSALIIINHVHCYKVKAIYVSETDTCESSFSNERCSYIMAGVDEMNQNFPVRIYPNPASDVLYIEAEEEIKSICIFNGRGEEVRRRRGEEGNRGRVEMGTMSVSLEGLAPGLYLVRVETGSGVVMRKVVIGR